MEALGLSVEGVPKRDSRRRSLRYYGEAAAQPALAAAVHRRPELRSGPERAHEAMVRDETFDLMICDGVQMTPHFVDLPVPKILFQHNAEARLLERHAGHDPTWPASTLHGRPASQDAAVRGRVRGVGSTRSSPSASRIDGAFERDYGWRHVRAIDTAVDLDYFRPSGRPEQATASPSLARWIGCPIRTP